MVAVNSVAVGVCFGLAGRCTVAAAELAGACASAVDCSLNGECVGGRCLCDSAWSGSPSCDVLAFEPMSSDTGYRNTSFASWGGNAIFADGKYHLFVAQMENHCGLDNWGSNSAIIRAESADVLGPYAYAERVISAFSHNPTVRRLPNGSFALYMIGAGGRDPSEIKNCSNLGGEAPSVPRSVLPAFVAPTAYSMLAFGLLGGAAALYVAGSIGCDPCMPLGAIGAPIVGGSVFSVCALVGGFALFVYATNHRGGDDGDDHRTAIRALPTLMNGSIYVSISPSVRGPWTQPTPVWFANHSLELWGGWTNPSPHFDADGTIWLAFQAAPNVKPGQHIALVGLSKAASVTGPFEYTSGKPVTPQRWWCVAGQDEDPFMWRSPRGFHIITHGMCPTGYLQAHYKFSEDGVTWHTSPRQTYPYSVECQGGEVRHFPRMERPQLVFAKEYPDGAVSDPVALFNGVCDDGVNYLSAAVRCILDQAGMTHTLVRPLRKRIPVDAP
mmetsp:Transcript_33601/g.95223  ORF Transcript_33601/g.95223 Transcript_33601/m.95223 type:complete len:498 (-) Transcript_33601:71-1564(-)